MMSKNKKKKVSQEVENGEEIVETEKEKKESVFTKIGYSVGTAYHKTVEGVKAHSKTIRRVGIGIGLVAGAVYGGLKMANQADADDVYEDCDLEKVDELAGDDLETEVPVEDTET